MFALTPRFLRQMDELTNPWDLAVPMLFSDGGLANLSGRLGDSEIQNTDKELRIRMDLRHYSPEEVKITSDSERITITAEHEEKQDNHGFVSRRMTRSYKLPDDADPKSITSTMNSQGTLSIKVTKRAIEPPKETVIPIEFKE